MTRAALRTAGLILLIALSAAGPLALSPAGAVAGITPRASLTDIEGDVMCVACREPLAVAESPQADSERAYIRGLIAKGYTKTQIEQNLVAQYGPAVLGKPPARGFNLSVYIIPPAILALGAAILVFTLPRWRRRTRAAARAPATGRPDLDPADAQRLDQELSQFRG
jgi:cytochrome c-type biogenesis protein CcmH